MMELIYVAIGFWLFYSLVHFKTEHGFVYAKYPWAHRNAWGSFPNPLTVKRGYIWTPISRLKNTFKQSDKNIVLINYFKFDEDYKNKSKMSGFFAKRAENTPLYFDPLKLTQGVLLVGKMGAGKTEFYFNIIKQKFYSRAIIHQIKIGDFTELFLTKNDILFSPYDKRGYLWDILSEDIGIIQTFFTVIMAAEQGEKKDFFVAAAKRIFQNLSIKIKTQYKDEAPAVKWMMFIKIVKDTFAEMEQGSQKSKQDVKSTMEIIFDSLEEQAWMMQDPKQKSFVIKDFFKRKKQCKLILDNIPEHEKKLTPIFSAFVASCSQIHTSLPDSKTDLTVYALDEYLSFASIMDKESKTRLHTLIRSKGGILLPAIQYIPADDKKFTQLLTSSAYAWIYFSAVDQTTIKLFEDTTGVTEYVYEDKSESKDSKGNKNYSFSNKHEKITLIFNEMLNGLGDRFEHIVYLPNHKMLYKGYTPQANLPKKAEKSVPTDLSEFYAIKYRNDNEEQEDYRNLTFADLFKEKPLSKLEEYKLFKKYEKAKEKKGADEAAELEKFRKEHKVEASKLELMFKKYVQDNQVLSNKMKMFSLNERIELNGKWRKIQGDEAEELAFIEQHDLFGALPGFFDFKAGNNDDFNPDNYQ